MFFGELNIHELIFRARVDKGSERRYSVGDERNDESVLVGERGSVQPGEFTSLGVDAVRPRDGGWTAAQFPCFPASEEVGAAEDV